MKIIQISFFLLFIFLFVSCSQKKSVVNSEFKDLNSFELADDRFQIELIASEPLVFDPVDMMIDENGKMYVVEMPGVPFDKSGTGKIVILSDSNDDGKMDQRTVFADSLSLPTGILKWKKGILVTDPPNVYYLEDTNGDDIADIKDTIMTGFDTSNLEANVNNPEYNIDNWVYLADLPVGGPGGIHFMKDSLKEGAIESSMRIKPDSFLIETLSGQTQFGQTFDTWGHHFMVNNSNHIYQNIFPNKYMGRNPNLLITNSNKTLASHNKVFPITVNPEYQMLTDVGVFTSACGNLFYQGNSFPDEYNENTYFVCEPASNIVHVDKLESTGVSYNAKDTFNEKEFLASKDAYSRIVNLYLGPDGALYLVDMYRQVIEGPEFMAQEVLDTVDLYNGTKKGRIYRISSDGTPEQEWVKGLNLGKESSKELVRKLRNRNGWWRINAQRLLVDRNDSKIIDDLEKMVMNDGYPPARLHALWTLEGMHSLRKEIIISALEDEKEGVRENAIKIVESHLGESPGLAKELLKLRDDPSLKVKFQLLLTLGDVHSKEAEKVKQDILLKNVDDEWIRLAALSDSRFDAISLLNRILRNQNSIEGQISELVRKISEIVGIKEPSSTIVNLIKESTEASGRIGIDNPLTPFILDGIANGLRDRKDIGKEIEKTRVGLMELALTDKSEQIGNSAIKLLNLVGIPDERQTQQYVQKAIAIMGKGEETTQLRVRAIKFLEIENPRKHLVGLKKLLSPKEPKEVQKSAVEALGTIPGISFSNFLIKNWEKFPLGVKESAINAFLMTEERIELLLGSVEEDVVRLSDINWTQSVRLRSLGNLKLRKKARVLFSKQEEGLQDLIKEYQSVLTQKKTDTKKGEMIYRKNCAMCHQVSGEKGRHIGPDLGTVHAWNRADIMANIIDPNRSIALGYDTWDIQLTNGTSVQGVILEETPNAIVINGPNYEKNEIKRNDIESMEALGTSIMPTDFGEKISKQEMADLLEFIKKGSG